jgi:AraC-like DNA-binding protein
LASDPRLALATSQAFQTLHSGELRIVRQRAMDQLLERLTGQLYWRTRYREDPRLPQVAHKAREYLHAHLHMDVGMDELALACSVDRFRLTRAFRARLACRLTLTWCNCAWRGPGTCWPTASNRRM